MNGVLFTSLFSVDVEEKLIAKYKHLHCAAHHSSSTEAVNHSKGAVAHVTAPPLFVESKNKKHVFVKIKACATDFLEHQKFSMDL